MSAFFYIRFIMITIYKKGGDWKTSDGREYTAKAINTEHKELYTSKGWVMSLDEIKKTRKAKAKKDDNEE